jgi:hypothetical protein
MRASFAEEEIDRGPVFAIHRSGSKGTEKDDDDEYYACSPDDRCHRYSPS